MLHGAYPGECLLPATEKMLFTFQELFDHLVDNSRSTAFLLQAFYSEFRPFFGIKTDSNLGFHVKQPYIRIYR